MSTAEDILTVEAADVWLTGGVGHRLGIWNCRLTLVETDHTEWVKSWKCSTQMELEIPLQAGVPTPTSPPPPPPPFTKDAWATTCTSAVWQSRNIAEVQLVRCDPIYIKGKKSFWRWSLSPMATGPNPNEASVSCNFNQRALFLPRLFTKWILYQPQWRNP